MSVTASFGQREPLLSAPTGKERLWSRISLAAVLLVAAGFRLWNLGGNQFGNIYYAAAVRSMAASWHNFLYGAFDPAGFLSLDKPPVAFWFQVVSVKMLGYNGFALHLPQAIEGILVVLLVYSLTRSVVGQWGGLLAGLVMTVTPASVAIDRSNLSDSCLLLVLMLSAWAMLWATEKGHWRWLLFSAALVGVGFTIKMMAAYIVLPTFYLLYWLTAPVGRKIRFAQLCAATAILFAVSITWFLFVDLTPKPSRPYAGDSENNSALSVALGRHGFGRISGQRSPSPPPGGRDFGGPPDGSRPFKGRGRPSKGPPPKLGVGPGFPPGPGPGFGGPGSPMAGITGHGGRPGLFRLASREMAGHITWFIPFAIVGLIALVLISPPRLPLSPLYQTVFLWCGWFVTHAVLFSLSPTHIHPYYLTMLGPPVAALVGIGSVFLWKAFERGGSWLFLPISAISVTAVWQVWVLACYPAWERWLIPPLLAEAAMAVVGLLVAGRFKSRSVGAARAGIVAMGVGLAALLVCPAIWSATPVLAPGGRMVPLADPALLEYEKRTRDAETTGTGTEPLVEFLRANHQNERFLMAVADLHLAAPIIIATGEGVMAYGGYTGQVPTVTADQFAAMVEAGKVRHVMLNERGALGSFGSPGPDRHKDLASWVRRHGREVESRLWRPAPPTWDDPKQPLPGWGPTTEMMRQMFRDPTVRLYDCRSLK